MVAAISHFVSVAMRNVTGRENSPCCLQIKHLIGPPRLISSRCHARDNRRRPDTHRFARIRAIFSAYQRNLRRRSSQQIKIRTFRFSDAHLAQCQIDAFLVGLCQK